MLIDGFVADARQTGLATEEFDGSSVVRPRSLPHRCHRLVPASRHSIGVGVDFGYYVLLVEPVRLWPLAHSPGCPEPSTAPGGARCP